MSDDILRMLRANDQRLSMTEVKEVGRTNYGSTKPSSWPIGVPFFDSTADFWVYWDGTRWLTAHEYEADITRWQQATMPYTGVAPATLHVQPIRPDYGYYVTRLSLYLFVATTNNGTNYWVVQIKQQGGGAIWAPDTSADAAGTNLNKSIAAAQFIAAGNGFWSVEIPVAGKVGAPGALTVAATVWYRLVIP